MPAIVLLIVVLFLFAAWLAARGSLMLWKAQGRVAKADCHTFLIESTPRVPLDHADGEGGYLLSEGDAVDLLAEEGDYYFVRWANGNTNVYGYVSRSDVQVGFITRLLIAWLGPSRSRLSVPTRDTDPNPPRLKK